MFAKKHCEVVASILHKHITEFRCAANFKQMDILVEHFADVFEQDSSKFDKGKFMDVVYTDDKRYVIFSLFETQANDDKSMFWSNSQGWVDLTEATIFNDILSNLPIGRSIRWMSLSEAMKPKIKILGTRQQYFCQNCYTPISRSTYSHYQGLCRKCTEKNAPYSPMVRV